MRYRAQRIHDLRAMIARQHEENLRLQAEVRELKSLTEPVVFRDLKPTDVVILRVAGNTTAGKRGERVVEAERKLGCRVIVLAGNVDVLRQPADGAA